MIAHVLLFGLVKHGHRLWHLLLFLSHILEELSSCMQLACFIEQRIHTSSLLRKCFQANSNLLSRSSACTPASIGSDKIGSQTRNRRGLDIADVIGVVVNGSRLVLTGCPLNCSLEWAHQPHIARL